MLPILFHRNISLKDYKSLWRSILSGISQTLKLLSRIQTNQTSPYVSVKWLMKVYFIYYIYLRYIFLYFKYYSIIIKCYYIPHSYLLNPSVQNVAKTFYILSLRFIRSHTLEYLTYSVRSIVNYLQIEEV